MVGFYRKFISRFTDAARPTTKPTRKQTKFVWSEDCQVGFNYLKTYLTESLILKYPNPQKRYVVFTDASDQAAATVVTQEYTCDDNDIREMPIACLSAQFFDTQSKWISVLKRLCNLYAIKKWRPYVKDAEILLNSDAKSLQKCLNVRTDNVKLDRWSLELQGRNIKVEHIPGYKNKAVGKNNNPIKDEQISINVNQTKENAPCYQMCEADVTDTKALQQNDRFLHQNSQNNGRSEE